MALLHIAWHCLLKPPGCTVYYANLTTTGILNWLIVMWTDIVYKYCSAIPVKLSLLCVPIQQRPMKTKFFNCVILMPEFFFNSIYSENSIKYIIFQRISRCKTCAARVSKSFIHSWIIWFLQNQCHTRGNMFPRW